MSLPPLCIIVATDAARGIGIANTLPWHLPEDLAHFKRTTTGHTIVMGRKTFDSIGRPLPNRRSIVVTRNPAWHHAGVECAGSVAAALALAGQDGDSAPTHDGGRPVYIIGGAQIYAAALPLASRLIVTEIAATYACDAFFPAIDPALWRVATRERHVGAADGLQAGLHYAFVTYERIDQK